MNQHRKDLHDKTTSTQSRARYFYRSGALLRQSPGGTFASPASSNNLGTRCFESRNSPSGLNHWTNRQTSRQGRTKAAGTVGDSGAYPEGINAKAQTKTEASFLAWAGIMATEFLLVLPLFPCGLAPLRRNSLSSVLSCAKGPVGINRIGFWRAPLCGFVLAVAYVLDYRVCAEDRGSHKT